MSSDFPTSNHPTAGVAPEPPVSGVPGPELTHSLSSTESLAEPILAEMVSPPVTETRAPPIHPADSVPGLPPQNDGLGHYSAIGGAVASLALGTWSIVSSWLTPLGIINSILGIGFGIWGLKSPRRRIALTGIVLSSIGFCLGVAHAAGWLTSEGIIRPAPPLEDTNTTF